MITSRDDKMEDDFENSLMTPKEEKTNVENITIKKSTYNNLLRGIVAAIAIATFVGGYGLGTMNTDSVSSDELNEILQKIEQRPAQPIQQPTAPGAPQIYRVSLDDDPYKGDPNAPLTVIEFSDFQCPFCSRFFTQTLPQIQENYIDTGKIKFVYKDLPLDSLHPNARAAHIAAECADEQEKFWEYHDVLFEKQSQWSSLASSELENTFTEFATDMGLQATSFESCMQSPNIADEVNKDTLEAASFGATGTPTFFIGTEKDGFIKLVGAQPYATFQRAIDNQLG